MPEVEEDPPDEEPVEDEPPEDEPPEDEPPDDEPLEDEPLEEPPEDEPPEDEPPEDEPVEDEPPEDEPLEDEPPDDEAELDELLSPPLDDVGPLEDDELPELGDELADPSPVEAPEPEELPLLGDDDDAEDVVAGVVGASPAELLPPQPAKAIKAIVGNNCFELIVFESKDTLSSPILMDLPRRQDLIFVSKLLIVRRIVRRLKLHAYPLWSSGMREAWIPARVREHSL